MVNFGLQPLLVSLIEDFSKSILTFLKFSIPTTFSLLRPNLVLECDRFSIIWFCPLPPFTSFYVIVINSVWQVDRFRNVIKSSYHNSNFESDTRVVILFADGSGQLIFRILDPIICIYAAYLPWHTTHIYGNRYQAGRRKIIGAVKNKKKQFFS